MQTYPIGGLINFKRLTGVQLKGRIYSYSLLTRIYGISWDCGINCEGYTEEEISKKK